MELTIDLKSTTMNEETGFRLNPAFVSMTLKSRLLKSPRVSLSLEQDRYPISHATRKI